MRFIDKIFRGKLYIKRHGIDCALITHGAVATFSCKQRSGKTIQMWIRRNGDCRVIECDEVGEWRELQDTSQLDNSELRDWLTQ